MPPELREIVRHPPLLSMPEERVLEGPEEGIDEEGDVSRGGAELGF